MVDGSCQRSFWLASFPGFPGFPASFHVAAERSWEAWERGYVLILLGLLGSSQVAAVLSVCYCHYSGIMEDITSVPEVRQVVPTSGEDNSHNFTVTTYSVAEVCIRAT